MVINGRLHRGCSLLLLAAQCWKLLHTCSYTVLQRDANAQRLEVSITQQLHIRDVDDLLAFERVDLLLRAAHARRGESRAQPLVHMGFIAAVHLPNKHRAAPCLLLRANTRRVCRLS